MDGASRKMETFLLFTKKLLFYWKIFQQNIDKKEIVDTIGNRQRNNSL